MQIQIFDDFILIIRFLQTWHLNFSSSLMHYLKTEIRDITSKLHFRQVFICHKVAVISKQTHQQWRH